jgi:hypothetical protein
MINPADGWVYDALDRGWIDGATARFILGIDLGQPVFPGWDSVENPDKGDVALRQPRKAAIVMTTSEMVSHLEDPYPQLMLFPDWEYRP